MGAVNSIYLKIIIDSLSGSPGPPTSLTHDLIVLSTCDYQATLQWAPPTNTGGLGVVITHYLVSVTGPVGYTCPPEQCNVTTTNTILTGLQCNTSYIVTVRAINCVGEGNDIETFVTTPAPTASESTSIV